ncbi:hypothetical protein LINPERHAP1_LOCUS24658 [Linum perenne]
MEEAGRLYPSGGYSDSAISGGFREVGSDVMHFDWVVFDPDFELEATGTSSRSANDKKKEFGRRLSEVVKDGATSPPTPSRTPPCLSRELKHRKRK